jgi:hypothetical protein
MGTASKLMVGGRQVDHGRLAAVCDRYGVVELFVFGSTARGEAGPDSDVDCCSCWRLTPVSGLRYAISKMSWRTSSAGRSIC